MGKTTISHSNLGMERVIPTYPTYHPYPYKILTTPYVFFVSHSRPTPLAQLAICDPLPWLYAGYRVTAASARCRLHSSLATSIGAASVSSAASLHPSSYAEPGASIYFPKPLPIELLGPTCTHDGTTANCCFPPVAPPCPWVLPNPLGDTQLFWVWAILNTMGIGNFGFGFV